MIYGDTSFLVAIYQSRDVFHAAATKIAKHLKQPIVFTPLGELELLTNVYRGLADKTIDRQQHDAILRQISEDLAESILVRRPINDNQLYRAALELARKHVPEIPLRSLDILHVAAAQLLPISRFVTFDARQNLLARRVGLNVLPNLHRSKPH
jgi:predicted nucleic acid-binding protein